jgi:GNAT superfamily N-acetyltransferase
VREAAEYPNSFIRLGPDDERIETPRFTLCMGAGNRVNTVQRQRFAAEEVDEVLEEVRALLRRRGRTRTQWEVGSAATPENLVSLLLARGLTWDRDPTAVALVLTTEPPPGPPDLTVRRVETLDEYLAACEVQFEAFETPPEELEHQRALALTTWDRGAPRITHAVWLNDRIVAAGTSAPTPYGLALHGGATLPSVRGRGAYRALIRARWEEATSEGLHALVTQAGAMSRPILQRLGFRPVGHIEMLIDDFGDD